MVSEFFFFHYSIITVFSLNELVKPGLNGLIFKTAEELAGQLVVRLLVSSPLRCNSFFPTEHTDIVSLFTHAGFSSIISDQIVIFSFRVFLVLIFIVGELTSPATK
jgi:hypothetical protein